MGRGSNCAVSVHQCRQRLPLQEIRARKTTISHAIQELKDDLARRRGFVYNDPQIDEIEEGQFMREVESCISSARDLVESMTRDLSTDVEPSWSPSRYASPQKVSSRTDLRSPTRSPNTTPRLDQANTRFDEAYAKRRGSSESEQNSDPEPDFQDGFSPEVYAELISTFSQEAQKELHAGNYQKAETAHLKAIEYLQDRGIKLQIPYVNQNQMYETLAEIYTKMTKYDQAKRILNNLLRQEDIELARKWRLNHLLATIYLNQNRLLEAEKFAKRAYIGREKGLGKGHALISQSADLLVQIYEKQGQKQQAQAFRNLHPNEKIVALAPQASKYIGKKKVDWNPDLSVDMNALDRSGKTILINAIDSGDEGLVQRTLQSGANIEARCSRDITPLMHAAIHGQVKIAGVLLSRGARADAITSGWTALQKASDVGDWRMVHLLLDNDANIEARGPKKFKVSRAPTARRESEQVDFQDEDTDSEDQHGWTALLRAADNGDEGMTRLLLDKSADIEAHNPSNGTPLACAAEHQHLPIVDLLVTRRANVNAEDEFGWRPLHRTLVRRGGATEIAIRLLNGGADVDARCEKQKTPLHHAIERDNGAVASILLNAGADIGARDIAKRTPLHLAIECRLEAMVHLLLESGADVTTKDGDGRDALAAANHALRKSPEIIKLLGRCVKELKKKGGASAEGSEGKARRISSARSTGSGEGDVASPTRKSSGSSWWSRRGSKKSK